MPMSRLAQVLAALAPQPVDDRTTPTSSTGPTDDPNVDTAGAGASPIEAVDLDPPGVEPIPGAPVPIVSTAPGYVPPGAPKSRANTPPARNLAAATYRVSTGDTVQIAPGYPGRRRVTLWVLGQGLYLAGHRASDGSGALLPTGTFVIHLETGSPLWVHKLDGSGGLAGEVSIVMQPLD